MKIAIFGGSFNPIHNGHVKLCEYLQKTFSFDYVHLVLAKAPPHKTLATGASDEARFKMLELALVPLGESFIADNRELLRGGVSYTFDTVLELEKAYGSYAEIFLIIGEDLAQNFYTWHRAEELLSHCKLIVAKRPQQKKSSDSTSHTGNAIGDKKKLLHLPHISIENPEICISSTQIRDIIKSDSASSLWKESLPKSVCKYIMENKLYDYQ